VEQFALEFDLMPERRIFSVSELNGPSGSGLTNQAFTQDPDSFSSPSTSAPKE